MDYAAPGKKQYEELKGEPFNFPLSHHQAVTELSPSTSSLEGSGKRSLSDIFPSEKATKRPRAS